LRMVQAFPDAPSAQLQLCEGLEAILRTVKRRLVAIQFALALRQREEEQIGALAGFMVDLSENKPTTIDPVVALAESILAQTQDGEGLLFLVADPADRSRFVACHSLTVARVMARVVRFDPELRSQSVQAVLCALLHDSGMMSVPEDILTLPGPLDTEQRRALERHTRAGAEMMRRLAPDAGWLAEAAASHHERLDGTGYPAGLKEAQLSSLTRLLSVCDIYAALSAPRPHRPALDTRTALTDTLLQADRGELDRFHAEKLMWLSAYPVGTVVELADGAMGVVVATHSGRRDAKLTHTRPVISLLTDSQGEPLPSPRHLDLAECEHRSIVRSLPGPERQELLAKAYGASCDLRA